MFIAGTLLTNGLPYIDPIIKALQYGAFVFAFAGFVEGAWNASEHMKAQLFNVLKIGLIALLAFNFPTIIQEGDKSLDNLHSTISEKQGAFDQNNQDAFLQQINAQATEPSWSDVAGRLTYSVGKCLQKIGWIGYRIVYWLKDVSLLLLISVSPLLIGFLALSYTKSIGVNFLITSLTVILWNIGFAIVDTLLIILSNMIMPIMATGATGVGGAVAASVSGVAVTVGPQFIVMCLVAAVLPISMYLSVPIITGAIMRGSNVAGAAMGAFGIAQQTASHVSTASSGVMSGVSSAISAFGNSSSLESGAVIPSLPTTSSPFMESRNGNSPGSMASQHSSPSGGIGGRLEGTSFSPSSSNFSGPSGITSPNGKMFVSQSDPGTISVTDSAGRTSSRAGKISDPVTVAAAFSFHEGTNT